MFITLEGIEGSGKSTLRSMLAERLTKAGLPHLLTREPGATAIGLKIRELLLSPDTPKIEDTTEALLFAADRAEHVATVIRPALAAGKIVICDRYTDSTLAYQGYGRGVSLPLLKQIIEIASGGLKPDLTLLLELPVSVGLSRATKRSASDRMEQLDVAFHERVRGGFLELAKTDQRFTIIDGSGSPETAYNQACEVLKARGLKL